MHRGDNNTFVDDKMATNSSPAIHLHLLVMPSATLILGWPWDMLWATGHWQHDTGRGAEKCLCGGACPELLSEPCERRCVHSLLPPDSQVSVTGLDVQQALVHDSCDFLLTFNSSPWNTWSSSKYPVSMCNVQALSWAPE